MDSNPPFGNVRQQDPPPPIQVPEVVVSSAPTTPSPTATSTFQDSSPRPLQSPPGGSSPSGQHATVRYRGTRCRSGKWVSEIREPRKTKRIWLGTYPTPDMAAAAYDVAALALKGPDTALNFPNSILSYPIPASLSPADIRAAAAAAAEARLVRPPGSGQNPEQGGPGGHVESLSSGLGSVKVEQFIDEDELLNMPSLLDDMARGMQVSPPRMNSLSADDSPGDSDGDNLWSFRY